MKNLKIEAEKGFRRTLFEPELVDPNREINFVNGLEAGFDPGRCTLTKQSRKGNILNDNVHVFKESEATHGADLTMFAYCRRVLCSPLMVVYNFSLWNQLV